MNTIETRPADDSAVRHERAGAHSPRISVLMPVFNAARYLEAAIESVRGQTFSDFELIAVDDGSTDDSLAMLRVYERIDERLRIITRPNTGIVGALNDALAVASGEYAARMDADDLCDAERFEAQVAFLDAHAGHVAVGTWVRRTDPDGFTAGEQHPPTDHEAIEAGMMRADLPIVHGSTMIRRAALEAIGGWRSGHDWVEDMDLFLRLAEVGRLANLPRVLYVYRRHVESVCATRTSQMVERIERVMREMYARRGLSGEPDFTDLHARLAEIWPAAEYYRSWACHAMESGHPAQARRHAWRALRAQPWSVRSWRVMAWALAA